MSIPMHTGQMVPRDLRPARGIVVALAITVPLWILAAAVVLRVLGVL